MTKGVVFTTIVLIISLLGFYFVLGEVSKLRNDVKNLELALEISNKEGEVIGEATSSEPTGESPELSEKKASVIPTAIIFDTISSPLLEPQTKITVTVESISKTEDGSVNVNIRAFTSEAETYSALQPQNFFELIDLEADGKVMKPLESEGAFSSIPPKSAAAGKVIFKIEPGKNSIILQINYENTIKYYELNFTNKTYKEAVLG
ncbi:hypothetical protein A2116_01860 [Candidatus Jorgensenbacteria bacterium GWA1_49_17]|uniref:Uncharacterized protein n=2 Tax=Candidatus Joergenseniibacteriota TaxID=1752739 RepID=A0A1F6BPY2_9BACT|nr:MAG: hypothetical protein A2127_01435 [Candidatus Jorgensenbacteria bacterium GWC1_48_12]OGG40480.1 MAG: hypothetical protein A2116_01860 [Candidatus Jorgensenbacteria bacterium GWA1_49_17]